MSYQFPLKFKEMISKSQYFVMNQESDIFEKNIFNHVAFLGKTKIHDVLEMKMPLLKNKNTIVKDEYMQLFFSQHDYNQNVELFEGKTNYSLVENFSEIFNGILRVENYYILLNSDHKQYNVYVLLDNNSKDLKKIDGKPIDLEFYGFIKIGHLINPNGYSKENIEKFEENHNLKVSEKLKNYLLNTSIVKYENRLFHINLDDINEQVKNKCKLINEKNISDACLDGFLEIGFIDIKYQDNKILNKKSLMLLINHNENYDGSLWIYNYENNLGSLSFQKNLYLEN
jgi:hypothetical protein